MKMLNLIMSGCLTDMDAELSDRDRSMIVQMNRTEIGRIYYDYVGIWPVSSARLTAQILAPNAVQHDLRAINDDEYRRELTAYAAFKKTNPVISSADEAKANVDLFARVLTFVDDEVTAILNTKMADGDVALLALPHPVAEICIAMVTKTWPLEWTLTSGEALMIGFDLNHQVCLRKHIRVPPPA